MRDKISFQTCAIRINKIVRDGSTVALIPRRVYLIPWSPPSFFYWRIYTSKSFLAAHMHRAQTRHSARLVLSAFSGVVPVSVSRTRTVACTRDDGGIICRARLAPNTNGEGDNAEVKNKSR